MAVTKTRSTLIQLTKYVSVLTFELSGTDQGTVSHDQPIYGEIMQYAYEAPNSGQPDANWDISLRMADDAYDDFDSCNILGDAGTDIPATSTVRAPYASGPVSLPGLVAGKVELAVANFGASTTRTARVSFFIWNHPGP